ncbi:hypothetical protein ADT26_18605 [Xanthomonas oryzae]|nr:hypothetical protein AXO1947_02510 [Xanthomonas oryzae pv. oryzae]KOR40210.1 hypothetical protein ADT26_18605 [Xanthomonas oryzae]
MIPPHQPARLTRCTGKRDGGIGQSSSRSRAKSGEQNVASSCQVGADGALTTAVDAWYMPIPSIGRARLAVSAVVLLAALSRRFLLWQ